MVGSHQNQSERCLVHLGWTGPVGTGKSRPHRHVTQREFARQGAKTDNFHFEKDKSSNVTIIGAGQHYCNIAADFI